MFNLIKFGNATCNLPCVSMCVRVHACVCACVRECACVCATQNWLKISDRSDRPI